MHVITVIRRKDVIIAKCSCKRFMAEEGRNSHGDYFLKRLEASIRAHEMVEVE